MRQRLHRALEITGLTDAGCSRTTNEDCITWSSKLGLAILTDGMGGAKAGDVAGQVAAETVLKEVREGIDALPSGLEAVDHAENHNRASLILSNALHKANSLILRIAQEQLECSGMGATTTAVLFYDNKLSVCHVGDSRLYLLRDGSLQQITEDHTVIQELIKGGLYTKEQAEESINKNIVTRAVGVSGDLKVEILEQHTLPGDLYLICSDGLTDLVSDAEIQQLLGINNDLARTTESLVDIAKNHGGNDNISVILIRVLKPYPARGIFRQRIIGWFFKSGKQ